MKKLSLFVTVTVILMIGAGLVLASNYEKGEREHRYERSYDDHDRALQLREMGEIMALEEILKHAKKEVNGRILELELEREKGVYLYEILILDAEGQLWEIELDATTGKILKRELED